MLGKVAPESMSICMTAIDLSLVDDKLSLAVTRKMVAALIRAVPPSWLASDGSAPRPSRSWLGLGLGLGLGL